MVRLNQDIVAELITPDGKIFIRKSIPITFKIARKMIDICEGRLKVKEKALALHLKALSLSIQLNQNKRLKNEEI